MCGSCRAARFGLRRLCWLLIFLVCFAWRGTARAQVNVEPLRQQVTEHRFGARINASTTTYAGNTRGVVFGGSALMGGRTERNFGYLDLSGDYARLSGVVSVAKWFAHLRHNFQLGLLRLQSVDREQRRVQNHDAAPQPDRRDWPLREQISLGRPQRRFGAEKRARSRVLEHLLSGQCLRQAVEHAGRVARHDLAVRHDDAIQIRNACPTFELAAQRCLVFDLA